MPNKGTHYERLMKALSSEKLVIFQYSCSDIFKPPITITSAFAINYFTDEEWCVLGNEQDFSRKVLKFLNAHKGYYFLFWNYNVNYSFQNFDLGLEDNELRKLINKCIDFDDVFEVYAENKRVTYLKKVKGGFDSRYYFALLNKIEVNPNWIWGGHEANIRDYQLLKQSSRIKAKVMAILLDKFRDNTLKVNNNKKLIAKSKVILGWRGLFSVWYQKIIGRFFIWLSKIGLRWLVGIKIRKD